MKNLVLALAALLIFSPLSIAKTNPSLLAQLMAGEITPSCGAEGSKCEWDHDCCNGNCNSDDVCGPSFCKGNGESCDWDHNCCSGNCNNGSCSKDAGGACRSDGSACDWDHNFCSNYCNSGTKTCE